MGQLIIPGKELQKLKEYESLAALNLFHPRNPIKTCFNIFVW